MESSSGGISVLVICQLGHESLQYSDQILLPDQQCLMQTIASIIAVVFMVNILSISVNLSFISSFLIVLC